MSSPKLTVSVCFLVTRLPSGGIKSLSYRMEIPSNDGPGISDPIFSGLWIKPNPSEKYEFVTWDITNIPISKKQNNACSKPPISFMSEHVGIGRKILHDSRQQGFGTASMLPKSKNFGHLQPTFPGLHQAHPSWVLMRLYIPL